MSKMELIRTLARYFNLDIPSNEEDIHNKYEWVSGCSFGKWDTPWLTLENVVDAIEQSGLLDDDDDDDWDD